MKFPTLILFILLCSCASAPNTSETRVSGKVTNFQGKPLEGADVHFQDKLFNNLVSVKTDKNGEFSADLPDKEYGSIFACKDYAKHYLEYWHWDYKPKENDFLSIQIDGLEVYGMKAWSTEPTYKSLIVFMRPMSLSRALAIKGLDKKKAHPVSADLNISSIKATVDGQSVDVLGINKVKEYISKNQNMDAYTVQVSTKDVKTPLNRLCLQLKDLKTGEQGLGCIDL